MRGSSFTSLSLAALVLAFAAWAGVWFLYSDVSGRLNERAQTTSSTAVQNAKHASAIEVTALASDTAAQRPALDQEVGADVVGIVNQIQSAGKAAGAATTIGSASSVGPPDPSSGTSQLNFVVQSTGTFAQVWRADASLRNRSERLISQQVIGARRA